MNGRPGGDWGGGRGGDGLVAVDVESDVRVVGLAGW